MPEKNNSSMEQFLDILQEREVDRLEAKRSDLTERIYPNMPATIRNAAEVIGMPEEILVRACVQAAWHYQSLEWHQVMDIVRSFFLAKKNIENKNS